MVYLALIALAAFGLAASSILQSSATRKEMKELSTQTIASIKEIGDTFDAKWKTAGDKVQALEDAIKNSNANTGQEDDPAVLSALADLKAHISGSTLPEIPSDVEPTLPNPLGSGSDGEPGTPAVPQTEAPATFTNDGPQPNMNPTGSGGIPSPTGEPDTASGN